MKLSRRIFSLFLTLVLFIGSFSMTAFAKGDILYGIGFVTASSLRLRSEPNTSSQILDTAENKECVVIISKAGSWYKVNYNLQIGYMYADYLSVLTRENAELGYGQINGTSVNLRSGPSTSHSKVAVGAKGDKVYIIGLNEGWFKVIYGEKICYIRSDYVDLTEIPYENKDSANSPKFFRGGKSNGVTPSASALKGNSTTTPTVPDTTVPEASTPSTPDTETTVTPSGTVSGKQIVAEAEKYLGCPYVSGGASPEGFDCSGFVYYVLKQLGYSPYRTCEDLNTMGTYVAKENLQPGDIVVFQNTYKAGISHVGIYVGNGQFIHSPNSRSVVSYADLTTGYWANHYYSARRVAQ